MEATDAMVVNTFMSSSLKQFWKGLSSLILPKVSSLEAIGTAITDLIWLSTTDCWASNRGSCIASDVSTEAPSLMTLLVIDLLSCTCDAEGKAASLAPRAILQVRSL